MGKSELNSNLVNQVLSLPNRDVATQVQLGSLLSVVHALSHSMAMLPHEREYNGEKGAPVLPEALIAGENALIKTFEQIENIVSDKDRWNFDAQRTMEAKLAAAYEAIKRSHNEQIIALRKSLAPNKVEGARLGRLDDGSYICWVGQKDNFDKCIFGIGASPEEAQTMFDQMFRGEIPKELLNWARSKFNNITEFTDEHEQLDDDGNEYPENDESGGEDSRGNSEGTEPDKDGSGPKG